MRNLLLHHSLRVGGLTFISRVLGFLRDVGLAVFLGTSFVADAFLVAFKLPNFFRRIFAEGALTQSFVPIFNEAWGESTKGRREKAFAFASHCGRWLFVVLTITVIVFEFFMPVVMRVLAPGFAIDGERLPIAIDLARLLFPFLLLSALSAWLGAILNVLGHYALAASSSIILNGMMIAAMLYYVMAGDGSVLVLARDLAYGVLIAGGLSVAALAIKAYQLGFRFTWMPEHQLLKRMIRLALPVALGGCVYQLGVFIDTLLATLLPQGSVAFLYYADRIAQLPLGVVGIAIGTVLLPQLSRLLMMKDEQQAIMVQHRAIFYGFLLAIPAAVALLILAYPITVTLFTYGAFDGEAARQTSWALQAFALGIPAFVGVKCLVPAFFARLEMILPVRIASIALTMNVIMSLILMTYIAHVGLALATSLASWFNLLALWRMLRLRGWDKKNPILASQLWRIVGASMGMGLCLCLVSELQAIAWLEEAKTMRALYVSMFITGGMAIYGLLLFMLGVTKDIAKESHDR